MSKRTVCCFKAHWAFYLKTYVHFSVAGDVSLS